MISKFNFFISKTYSAIEQESDKIWKFDRYKLVFEYFHKPILPPPFVLFYYIILAIKFVIKLIINKKFKKSDNIFIEFLRKKIKIYKSGFCK